MKKLFVATLLFLMLVGAAYLVIPSLVPSFGGVVAGDRLTRARRSPQHHDGTFRNLVPTELLRGSIWRTLWLEVASKEVEAPPAPLPIEPRRTADYARAPRSGLRVTWLGHASTLIEIDGQRVLTDPIFSERCSPVSFAGPRRSHPAPIALNALPTIDAVVISHDHFDHLDREAMTVLAARGTRLVVPLGIGAHLERWGIASDRFVELEWWQSERVGGLTITSTPARHYSGRFPGRGQETLWSSWAIVGEHHRAFYSGDTGYAPTFAEIGQRLGPFDLAVVKIGAYGETWPEIHVTPEDAVRIHQDVRGKMMLPVHWGTFDLSHHRWDEPADRVVAAAKAAGVALAVPRPGAWVEPRDVLPGAAVPAWWSGVGR